MTIAISVLIFIAVFAVVVGLCMPIVQEKATLRQADDQRNALLESPLGPLISLLAKFNSRPAKQKKCARLEQKLLYAGRPGGRITGGQFIAALQLFALGTALLMIVLMSLTVGFTLGTLVFAVIVAGMAYGIGYLWLDNAVAERRTMIGRQFPYFLDLGVMTIEAGSSFTETVDIYVRDNAGDALAEELRITTSEIRMGKTLREGLQALHDRITSEDVQNAIRALIQGQRMGTPLGQVIRDQADAMRFRRSQLAERAAEELKVKMQGPAMLLMLSVLLLILGPAFLNMMNSGVL